MLNDLRILSLNVRYCQGQDGAHSWKARLPRVLRLVENVQPHILCFQEVLAHQRTDIESFLPQYSWYGQGRNQDFSGEQCPIGVAQRFLVFENKTSWLSETPEKSGSVGWDACLPRIATTVSFEHRGRQIRLLNTHLDHLGNRARVESARLIRNLLEQTPAIVTGDFNCGPDSEAIQVMKEILQVGTPSEPTHTFHDFGKEQSGSQIDYIFADHTFQFQEFSIKTEPGPDFYSDHFALVAQLEALP